MIKNIVFDLGNVLIKFVPQKFIDENVKEEHREEFMKVIFKGQEWQDLDRGTLEYKDALKFFIKKIPHCQEPIKKLFENFIIDCLIPVEENVEILKKLNNKYNLYIISNFHGPAFKNINKKWKFFSLFEGKIISSHVKCLKPEEKIYKLLFNKYLLNPKECLFIDDSLENVEASIKLGMDAVHLKNPKDLRGELLKKKILK